MADRFGGRIIIGGQVSEAAARQIRTEARSIEVKPSLDEILAGDIQYLEMEDQQLPMGEFGDVEQFLERERIPYIRYSDGYDGYRPERVMFRPDQGYDQPISEQVSEGGVLEGVTVEELKNIRRMLHQGNTEKAEALLKELLPVEMPELPPFKVR